MSPEAVRCEISSLAQKTGVQGSNSLSQSQPSTATINRSQHATLSGWLASALHSFDGGNQSHHSVASVAPSPSPVIPEHAIGSDLRASFAAAELLQSLRDEETIDSAQ